MKYHDKRYPHIINVRINEEQYNKIKHNKSEIIRTLIDKYENQKVTTQEKPRSTDSIN